MLRPAWREEHEVRVDGALTGLRITDDEPGAALSAEDTALEIVIVNLGRIGCGLVGTQNDLDLLPHLDADDRIVGSAVTPWYTIAPL